MNSDSDSPTSSNRDDRTSANNNPVIISQQATLPKRGAKACAACRKGKNRCVNDNGQPPCRRCASTGAACVFESAPGKGLDEERLERIERSVGGLNETVSTLLGYLRAGLNQPAAPPQFPPSFDPSPTNYHRQQLAPPVLPNAPSSSGAPLRLDADFNARSPSNPLHWELQMPPVAPQSNDLADLLGNHPQNHLPPIRPSSARQQHQYLPPRHPPDSVGYLGMSMGGGTQLQPPVLPPMPPQPPSSKSSPADYSSSNGSSGRRPSAPGIMSSVSFSSPPSASHHNDNNGSMARNKRQRPNSPMVQNGYDNHNNPRYHTQNHPPLPNYPAPRHPISQYGIVPSNAPSDDEDALPTASLTAPFEALAEAAAAAASGSATPVHKGRFKKRQRRMPPPPNAFPDVIEKGLVADELARTIFAFYFQSLHQHVPILDPSTIDTYESMRERTPWAIDSIIAAAASRMVPQSRDIADASENATEEAMGIARSSLFAPTVRKEGVQAMALLAAWADNGYLATCHALRMGFELGLHRALEKLLESGKERSQEEERDLVVSARVYLGLVWLDFVISIGSGRPHLYDEDSVSTEKLDCFLRHPFSVASDKVLAANIELIGCRTRTERGFGATSGPRVADFVRRASRDLQSWYQKWDGKMADSFEPNSFERQNLLCAYHGAAIFLSTIALKGQSIGDASSLSVELRECALNAREAAHDIVNLWLNSSVLKDALRYATQCTFVDVAFSALLLLKLSRLFPEGTGSLSHVVNQCSELQNSLRLFPRAERYAMTLRIALERFCKTFDIPLPSMSLDFSSNDVHTGNGHNDSHLMMGSSVGDRESRDDLLMGPPLNFPNFDLSSFRVLSDQNWVGAEAVPAWLSDPASWTFEGLDMSEGLNQVFLPSWSTYAADW